MINIHPDIKAAVVTLGFFLAAVLGIWWGINDWDQSLPLAVFYGVLLLNTFFSIRCFARITPAGQKVQDGIDVILVLLYIGLASSFNNSLRFVSLSLLLFIVATVKYILLMLATHHFALLKRKIFIDTLGTLACAFMLGALLYGYSTGALWIWSAAFIVANIHIFFIKPLYRIS